MVAAAFAALALSRELPPIIVAATVVGGALSFFAEPSRHAALRSRWWGYLWNTATLVAFSWTILDALRGEALFSGVRFLCFLLVNKLWNRRASRDYLQAYVVSFLMLVAGSVLNADLTYGLCFLGYVVFSTWTLTLFHLRREMEENYLVKHSAVARPSASRSSASSTRAASSAARSWSAPAWCRSASFCARRSRSSSSRASGSASSTAGSGAASPRSASPIASISASTAWSRTTRRW